MNYSQVYLNYSCSCLSAEYLVFKKYNSQVSLQPFVFVDARF